LPCRKGPPNGPVGLRVSAMRHGVTGTKLKPVSVESTVNAAEAVLPLPPFSEIIAGAGSMKIGVAVGEGLRTGVEVAAVRTTDADAGLDVPPTAPPQPAKKNIMRDKQISEKVPEARNESWRRIDYLSAI
jgi:hypothetical protein